jgi:RNA polymerase sigma-70 factor, ECF subfamily
MPFPRSAGASLAELEELYRDRLPHFRRVAAAIVADRETACDVVQEAFGTAIRQRRSFRRTGPLEAWVWRILVNAARDHAAAAVLQPPRPELHRNGSARHDEDVRAAIALLPERQRLALFLRYYADLDYDSIAAALDIAPGTVAATLHAAHGALRKTLQEVLR